jgi:hypothetical protein
MKKISFVVGRDYLNNRIFNLSDKSLNRDNCLYPFFLLKQEFAKRGYELLTSDLVTPEEATFILYNEMPKPFPNVIDPSKSYLMLFESELIRADNWDVNKHKEFKKIFTWHDDFVDNKKYVKFNFPNEIKLTPVGVENRKGFLTSISGNKTNNHPLELYSKRLETMKWFEEHHPDHFDYYGIGWDYKFNVRWQKLFRKLNVLQFMPSNRSLSYKGRVEEKLNTLRNYKFALCYENGRDINGYITEKIFDCLFAGTIPIYWGPKNVSHYVPENCFIDRTKFKTDEDLFRHLNLMNDSEVIQYQKNIEAYLKGEQIKQFSNEFFVENIIKGMLDE